MEEGLFGIAGAFVGTFIGGLFSYFVNKKNNEQRQKFDLEKWEKEKGYEKNIWIRDILFEKMSKIVMILWDKDDIIVNPQTCIDFSRKLEKCLSEISLILGWEHVIRLIELQLEIISLSKNFNNGTITKEALSQRLNEIQPEIIDYLHDKFEEISRGDTIIKNSNLLHSPLQ